MIEIHKQLLTCNWNYAACRAFLPNNIHWPYFYQLQEHPSLFFFFFSIDKNQSKSGKKSKIRKDTRDAQGSLHIISDSANPQNSEDKIKAEEEKNGEKLFASKLRRGVVFLPFQITTNLLRILSAKWNSWEQVELSPRFIHHLLVKLI